MSLGKHIGVDQKLANWVSGQQGRTPVHWTNFTTIAFADEKGLLCGWIVQPINQPDVCVHIAAARRFWAHREIFETVFDYLFNFLNVRRVTAPMSVDNIRCIRLAEAVGFQREGLLRQANLDGGDLVLYGMLRGECRWIKEKHDAAVAA